MSFVYIVECVDGTLYTGWAVDVAKRIAAHNAGRGARYTRMHGPVKLVYVEKCESRAAALKREARIKKLPRVKKLALIRKDGKRKT
ncbi:MAG TPA: GIY-YIG nuclease family protein [Anaerolineae bacterium]